MTSETTELRQIRAGLVTAIASSWPAPVTAAGRRTRQRFGAGLAVALAVCVTAAWSVASFHFNPFARDPSPLTTAQVRAWMTTNYSNAPYRIKSDTVAAVGTFSTPKGETTVYSARSASGSAYVTAYVRAGKIVTGMGLANTALGHGPIRLSADYLSPSEFGRVWQIWGVAPPMTASMSLGYPDGTTVRVPLHHGVFLALIPADCNGPTGLTARDSSGATIAETSKLEISSGC